MRSSDAFKGLPHDIFCFTMLQEMIARDLGLEVGSYHHFAGSLHLYEDNINGAKKYLSEGIHSLLAMPPMPLGPQWDVIPKMMAAEQRVRDGAGAAAMDASLDPYWQDLLRLLLVFEFSGDEAAIDAYASQMTSGVYRTYLERRKSSGKPKPKNKG
jgi:thymidylate synthase